MHNADKGYFCFLKLIIMLNINDVKTEILSK